VQTNQGMTLDMFLTLMADDLANEYKHMHFYLHSAIVVRGLHREELGEYFLKEAASEMKHVEDFGKMLLGMGSQVPVRVASFPTGLTKVEDILAYIMEMEGEVVQKYHDRMRQAEEIGTPEGSVLHVFYEEQILDSRLTFHNVREMLRA
jgi:bacterioferritin (cytochrome b1)